MIEHSWSFTPLPNESMASVAHREDENQVLHTINIIDKGSRINSFHIKYQPTDRIRKQLQNDIK